VARPRIPDGLWNQFRGTIQRNEDEEIKEDDYNKILEIALERLQEAYE